MSNEKSPMYDELKEKWDNGYIREDTMRTWVKVHIKNPQKGISAEEFTEITGIAY